jgi:hypothetical protein
MISLYDFENRNRLFADIDSRFRFCLLTITGAHPGSVSSSACFGWLMQELEEISLPDRLINISAQEVALFNPASRTCPIFTSNAVLELARVMYRVSQHIYISDSERFATVDLLGELFNLTRDAKHFISRGSPIDKGKLLQLYEAKYFQQFDHRFATEIDGDVRGARQSDKETSDFVVKPRKFVRADEVARRLQSRGISDKWFLGFRRIASATNERTSIATVLPLSAVGNTINLVLNLNASVAASFLANLNSFAFDYCCRQKVSGTDINLWIFKQLPVVKLERLSLRCEWESRVLSLGHWLASRALELTFTGWDLATFGSECGWDGPPFRWNEERRFQMQCELDAAFFRLYLPADKHGDWHSAVKSDGCSSDEVGQRLQELRRHFPTPRDAVDYIMDTFPIVRRKDEGRYGEYRTKRVILEIYDAMQAAVCTGQPYQTVLDPPPGPPVAADGNFVSYADIADDPPPHIHLPRDFVPDSNVAMQLLDLAMHFPDQLFRLRLNTGEGVRELQVRPVRTSDLTAVDTVVLASPNLQHLGAPVPAAVGRLRVESRTDAEDGSTYLLVSVRGDDGVAQARFSEDEWQGLTTVGVVMDGASAEAGNG